MCSWLQPYFSCCCEITASFVIQQLQSSSCVTYPHIMSALQLIQKVFFCVDSLAALVGKHQFIVLITLCRPVRGCNRVYGTNFLLSYRTFNFHTAITLTPLPPPNHHRYCGSQVKVGYSGVRVGTVIIQPGNGRTPWLAYPSCNLAMSPTHLHLPWYLSCWATDSLENNYVKVKPRAQSQKWGWGTTPIGWRGRGNAEKLHMVIPRQFAGSWQVQLSFYFFTVFLICSLYSLTLWRVLSHSQVIAHVNTAIPATFIEQLLGPGSPVMKLRLSSDQAVRTILLTYRTNLP